MFVFFKKKPSHKHSILPFTHPTAFLFFFYPELHQHPLVVRNACSFCSDFVHFSSEQHFYSTSQAFLHFCPANCFRNNKNDGCFVRRACCKQDMCTSEVPSGARVMGHHRPHPSLALPTPTELWLVNNVRLGLNWLSPHCHQTEDLE